MPASLPAMATRAIAPTSDRRSSASATSSGRSMQRFPKSRTSPRSATAGGRRRSSPSDGGLSHAANSGGRSRDIRAAAAETVHAFKGPLATIQSSIEPLRRAVPSDDARARRALALIEASVGRLQGLIDAAYERDCALAAALERLPE